MVAWGGNNVGQSTPCAANVIAIAAGYEHSLLLKGDGTVTAWGGNFYGQTDVPTGLSNVVSSKISNPP